MSMKRFAVTLVAALVAAGLSSANAEPPWKRGGGWPPGHAKKYGPPGHARHDRANVHYDGFGPPPWAPAHGYRRKHQPAAEAYVAPFGIDVGHCNRETLGQVLGGVVGAVVGSQIGKGTGKDIAIVAGTIIGVIVGGQIGRDLDRVDQACVGQALEHAPNGKTIAWNNPENDARYRVTPTQTYRSDTGRYCREYTTTATVGGRSQQVYGTACRQPDGSWEIVS